MKSLFFFLIDLCESRSTANGTRARAAVPDSEGHAAAGDVSDPEPEERNRSGPDAYFADECPSPWYD